MGDAREIKIPRDALIGMMTDLGILYRAGASENEWFPKLQQAVANLEASGFRILGPDEVDQVTVDDVAAELWKAEAEDAGAPASIANGRTRDAFDDQSDELKRRWRKFARAATRALGRKA